MAVRLVLYEVLVGDCSEGPQVAVELVVLMVLVVDCGGGVGDVGGSEAGGIGVASGRLWWCLNAGGCETVTSGKLWWK